MIDIVDAAVVGSLARLEPLAREVYSVGDRPRGWFQRKLRRECVDPGLSRLVVRRGDDPTRRQAWLGYALVGRPPSIPASARTAGIGLVPAARGQGHGLSLVRAVSASARAAGCTQLRVPAPPGLLGFYGRAGLRPLHRRVTLLHFGAGSRTSLRFGEPGAWEDGGPGVGNAWLREAWERTEPELRTTVALEGATLQLAKEGLAIACHRSAGAPTTIVSALEEVRQRVRDATPLIVVHSDPVSPVTAALLEHGWTIVQETVVVTARWTTADAP